MGLDDYSQPLKTERTRLATLFTLHARDSRKGRLFIPVYDERFPLVFKAAYAYVSQFLEQGNVAGNHYHEKKEEILIPAAGTFEIRLEDVVTKETETLRLAASEHKALYLRTGIAHSIVSLDATGVLLVLASHPSSLDDEIAYVPRERS